MNVARLNRDAVTRNADEICLTERYFGDDAQLNNACFVLLRNRMNLGSSFEVINCASKRFRSAQNHVIDRKTSENV